MQDYVEQRHGGFYVAGTRVALDSIVHAFQRGESPEEILGSFPMAGPLVKIYGALTFYLENKEQVERYMEEQHRLWDDLARLHSDTESPLAKRLREAKEHAGSESR